ncbi:hypothetical protein V502_03050 [Pseudogymnoascus sp. VKM F-4520 (FW-2644)]|nr:hypothetical protein V502_03050 [Pseudogymnoascus sp. VKM F-4520 (FW-2644)]
MNVGNEEASTLTSMNELGLALDDQGKYKEAEAMHRQTLALREKVLGKEYPDMLTSMNIAGMKDSFTAQSILYSLNICSWLKGNHHTVGKTFNKTPPLYT